MKTSNLKHIDKLFIIFFFQVLVFQSFGQRSNEKISCIVKDEHLGIELPDAYIILPKNGIYGYTDSKGVFSLNLERVNYKLDDKVIIGSPGYQTKYLIIDSLLTHKIIEIYLLSESNFIEEVVVMGSKQKSLMKIVRKSFTSINKYFINQDFISEIYVLQKVEENGYITKYKELYNNVYHPGGYSRLLSTNSINEKVLNGNIRETKDYSEVLLNGSYPETDIPNWYFFWDDCKYKTRLLNEMKNYTVRVLDTIYDNDASLSLLLDLRMKTDTTFHNAVVKTDYIIKIGNNYCIKEIISKRTLYYDIENGKRIFNATAKCFYTNKKTENYLDSISFVDVDQIFEKDSNDVLQPKSYHKISTNLKTLKIELTSTQGKKKESDIKYNEKFWKNKPLVLKADEKLLDDMLIEDGLFEN